MSLCLVPLHAAAASLGDLAHFRSNAPRHHFVTNASLNALAALKDDQECMRDQWQDFLGPRVATWVNPAELCQPEVDVQSLEVHDLHALLIHPDTTSDALVTVLAELRVRFDRVLDNLTAVV